MLRNHLCLLCKWDSIFYLIFRSHVWIPKYSASLASWPGTTWPASERKKIHKLTNKDLMRRVFWKIILRLTKDWPLHQMGFVHSTQVQNKSHTHSHLSLLPGICSSASLLQSVLKIFENLCFKTIALNGCSKPKQKHPVILLPYLGLQSNQISKLLKSYLCNFYSFVNLKIIFHSSRQIFLF